MTARTLHCGLGLLCLSLCAEPAQAQLRNLIPGLYGGDGITLARGGGTGTGTGGGTGGGGGGGGGAGCGTVPDHRAHFTVQSAESINQLNDNIAAQVAIFPFSSISSGFSFAFNSDLGTFLKTTESLGPIFAERPRTVGKGKFNVNLSYTTFKYDKFEGKSLNNLEAPALHDADSLPPLDRRTCFELDELALNFDIDIRANILALTSTFGVTDNFDIGILIPYVNVRAKVKSHAELRISPNNPTPGEHRFGTEGPDDEASGKAWGLGDILLQAKYHWYKSDTHNLAAAVLVKTATGDKKDFLGTGDTTVRPYLIYATSFGNFSPHVNLGYKFNLKDSRKSAIEYVAGFDYGRDNYTIAVDVFGYRQRSDGIGDNIINGSLGIKWRTANDYILSANVLVPLNDSGLRSNLISTVAVERSF
ncbi:MAG TPA: transporter [Casimicrobiaceae bacterium]|nr:transporter [Casimicrobiaceae bacterium]